MIPSSFQMHKVDVLLEYKELLAQLYQLCNRRFPEHIDLWQKLFSEKFSHIKWVKSLQPEVDTGTITINPTSFKVEALRFLIQALQTKINDLENEPITFLQALIFAKDTEDGMLEKNFFSIFQGSTPEFMNKKSTMELEHQNNVNLIKSTLFDINKLQR